MVISLKYTKRWYCNSCFTSKYNILCTWLTVKAISQNLYSYTKTKYIEQITQHTRVPLGIYNKKFINNLTTITCNNDPVFNITSVAHYCFYRMTVLTHVLNTLAQLLSLFLSLSCSIYLYTAYSAISHCHSFLGQEDKLIFT